MILIRQHQGYKIKTCHFSSRSSSPWTTTSTPSRETRSLSSRSAMSSAPPLPYRPRLSVCILFVFVKEAQPVACFLSSQARERAPLALFTASLGQAVAPPSLSLPPFTCLWTQTCQRRAKSSTPSDAEVFRPFAAIISITVVINVYFLLTL